MALIRFRTRHDEIEGVHLLVLDTLRTGTSVSAFRNGVHAVPEEALVILKRRHIRFDRIEGNAGALHTLRNSSAARPQRRRSG